MNILHKGISTAVVATLVTSGIILLTGNSVADSSIEVSKSIEPVMSKASLSTKQFIYDENVAIAPPPGPYLNIGALVVGGSLTQLLPATITAPIEPVINIESPKEPITSMKLGVNPAEPKKVLGRKVELKKPVMPFAPIRPSFSLQKLEKPKFVQEKRAAPNFGKAPPSLVPSKFKKLVSPAEPINNYQKPQVNTLKSPIWMLQDHNKINALNLNQRKMPATNSKGFDNRFMQRSAPNMGLNRAGNYQVQQYMYVPIPMLQSGFVAPQAPVFRAKSASAPIPVLGSKQNNNQSAPNVSEFMKKDSN